MTIHFVLIASLTAIVDNTVNLVAFASDADSRTGLLRLAPPDRHLANTKKHI